MAAEKLAILVTGSVASGKTTFLLNLHAALPRWRSCGFVSRGESRGPGERGPAASYRLVAIGGTLDLPWATRRSDGAGFDFCDASRSEATELVRRELENGEADVCFLDEIGRLELDGRGMAEAFRLALGSPCPIVVAAVKKAALADVIRVFQVVAPIVIDLDGGDAERALRAAARECGRKRSADLRAIGGDDLT